MSTNDDVLNLVVWALFYRQGSCLQMTMFLRSTYNKAMKFPSRNLSLKIAVDDLSQGTVISATPDTGEILTW
jgi:hypothetical protein